MKWKAPRAATTTDTGSQPTRVSRRGGHLVIDGLSAQMHNGLPTSVLPTKPLSRSNDPTIATGQQAQAIFHTRSLCRTFRGPAAFTENASDGAELAGGTAGATVCGAVQQRRRDALDGCSEATGGPLTGAAGAERARGRAGRRRGADRLVRGAQRVRCAGGVHGRATTTGGAAMPGCLTLAACAATARPR
jgi:hypothetical protein